MVDGFHYCDTKFCLYKVFFIYFVHQVDQSAIALRVTTYVLLQVQKPNKMVMIQSVSLVNRLQNTALLRF